MHPAHAALLADLHRHARPINPDAVPQNDSYGGSGRPYLNVSAPAMRGVAKAWLAANKTAGPSEVLAVVESLFGGETHEEKTLAALMLGYARAARAAATPADLDRWLGCVNGWAEVDALCQNVFQPEDFARDWPAWRGLIARLTVDANINKRRAALVLLNAPVRYSDEARYADLAFATIAALKAERPILITKAVSWLLRTLTERHRGAVEAYLEAHAASLPAIAVRETRVKLATGTKSGRRRGV